VALRPKRAEATDELGNGESGGWFVACDPHKQQTVLKQFRKTISIDQSLPQVSFAFELSVAPKHPTYQIRNQQEATKRKKDGGRMAGTSHKHNCPSNHQR
jgi:hypothetical protein